MRVSELREILKQFKGDAQIGWITHYSKEGNSDLCGLIDEGAMTLREANAARSFIELEVHSRPLKSKQRDSADMS